MKRSKEAPGRSRFRITPSVGRGIGPGVSSRSIVLFFGRLSAKRASIVGHITREKIRSCQKEISVARTSLSPLFSEQCNKYPHQTISDRAGRSSGLVEATRKARRSAKKNNEQKKKNVRSLLHSFHPSVNYFWCFFV